METLGVDFAVDLARVCRVVKIKPLEAPTCFPFPEDEERRGGDTLKASAAVRGGTRDSRGTKVRFGSRSKSFVGDALQTFARTLARNEESQSETSCRE